MLLSSGQRLTLYELNKEKNSHQVKINKFIRNNGKTNFNVYSAVSRRKRGFLYELFDESFLERGKTGKPVLSDKSMKSDFIEYRIEISSGIETLRSLKILPETTILYGNPVNEENISKKACSLYIWVPFEATSNITDYISEGNDKTNVAYPEHKMDGIIRTAITITETMSRINAAGFRFDDLSTDDIFIKHEKKAKINKESIKPVCLDLIVSASPDLAFFGDSDLLGRILFRMITGKEYKSDFFGAIHKEISDAPLVLSSCRNGSVYVVNYICDIIRKSVSEEYSDYSQILSDLYTLKDNFLYENKNHDVGTIRPLDSSKTTSETKIDSTIVIQNMLDSRPLYCCSPPKITSLHILAVGCGNYGQEFINQSLQHGQMDGVTLRITAISDNPDTDKKYYLANKPALGDFVRINGSKIDDPYAELNFEPISKNGSAFSLINKSENERLIKELIRSHKDVSYIFVALGNEKLNKDVAELFAEFADDFTNGCCVNYACQSESYKCEKAWPVCINSRSSKKISKELRDMALKVHLSWNKITDKSLDVIREEFERNHYDFSSSLSNAINIRYKLHCLGIEYDFRNNESLHNAAKVFNRTVLLNSDKTNFNRLVWLEHRRWIIEKAVSSWKALPEDEFEKIISLGDTRDRIEYMHPCLVRSTPTHADDIWSENADTLDPLDSMSVKFNAAMKKAAEKNMRNWPEQEDLIALAGKRIREFHIESKEKSLAQYAYNRYVVAIKNILSESKVYAKNYKLYYNKLLSACEDLGGEEFRTEISSLLKQVDTAMFPIVESAKKVDYKAIDAFLVTKIPYILTVPLSPNIAMCFSAKYGNAETLNNIAATLALSTNKIYYFYYYDSDSNVSFLIRKIKLVKKYLEEKKIYCNLNFFIAVAPKCEPIRTVLEENLGSIGVGCLVKSCPDEENAHEQFKEYLSDKKISFFNRSVNAHIYPYYNMHLHETMDYPWFEFILEKNRLLAPQCSYLEYIDTSGIHLTTEDLLILSNAKDSSFHFSEIFDSAKNIWERIYQKNPDYFNSNAFNWNILCQQISKHFLKNDAWVTIPINNKSVITSNDDAKKTDAPDSSDKPENKITENTYTLPATCFKTAKKIANALAKENLIIDQVVKSKLSGVCEISFKARKWVALELKKVFENTSADTLSNSEIIEAYVVYDTDKDNNFVILYNTLCVKDLNISKKDKEGNLIVNGSFKHILTALKNEKLIKKCASEKEIISTENLTASFVFSSHAVKNIMKKEGELLENYIFYEAVRTGYFDDVVGGFEFIYDQIGSKEPIKNEVDCLLTKGNKTIVLEAKARSSIDQDVIHKLCNVASNIGVNAKKVLVITDHGRDDDEHTNKINETQFARGDKDEVIIVSGCEEILNIGETLIKITEGTYIPPKDYFDI